MADNYVFKNLIWKFAGLNLILSAIGKWYTFQLLSGTLFDYHIHVKFAYMKLNGEVRIAVGTLQKDSVEASVNGNGLPKRFYGMFVYQDLLRNLEWRGFKEERFIGTIEN